MIRGELSKSCAVSRLAPHRSTRSSFTATRRARSRPVAGASFWATRWLVDERRFDLTRSAALIYVPVDLALADNRASCCATPTRVTQREAALGVTMTERQSANPRSGGSSWRLMAARACAGMSTRASCPDTAYANHPEPLVHEIVV